MLQLILIFLCPFFIIISIAYLANRNRYFEKYGIKTYSLRKYLSGTPIRITANPVANKSQFNKVAIDQEPEKNIQPDKKTYENYETMTGVPVQVALIKSSFAILYPAPNFQNSTELLKLEQGTKITYDAVQNSFVRTKFRTEDNEIKAAWIEIKDLDKLVSSRSNDL